MPNTRETELGDGNARVCEAGLTISSWIVSPAASCCIMVWELDKSDGNMKHEEKVIGRTFPLYTSNCSLQVLSIKVRLTR